MRTISIGALLLVLSAPASARDVVYEGTWLTTNRKLDGTLTCVVTELGDKLRGQAMIDGAFYEWTGEMDKDSRSFKGRFDGSRYRGSFSLKRKGN